jgi:hypothetical protein
MEQFGPCRIEGVLAAAAWARFTAHTTPRTTGSLR